MKQIHWDRTIGISFLGIAYNVGGASELPGERGISHLMEHLICKTFDDLQDSLQEEGIDFNAYTSDLQTVFWFKGLPANLSKYAKKLFERITEQPRLWNQESFEQEKRTVLQEYGDSFNDPTRGKYLNLLRKHYGVCKPIGFKRDIEQFSFLKSLERAKVYSRPDMVATVGLELELPTLGEVTRRSYANPSFSENSGLELESVTTGNKVCCAMLGTKPLEIEQADYLQLAINGLTSGLNSPLYQEIREKRGLSYFSSGWMAELGKTSVPMFMACTNPEREEELREVYREFFRRKPEEMMTKARFETVKRSELISRAKRALLPQVEIEQTQLRIPAEQNIESFSYESCLQLVADYLCQELKEV